MNASTFSCRTIDVIHTDAVNVIDSTVIAMIVIIALIENIIVLRVLYKMRLIPTYVFIGSLSLSDLSIVILPLPLLFALYVGSWNPSLEILSIFVVIDNITSVTSVMALMALACDRYFIIVHPYKYQRLVTVYVACLISIFIWLYSACVGTLMFIIEGGRLMAVMKTIVLFFIPSIVMLICHIQVAMVAKRHARNIMKLQVSRQTTAKESTSFSTVKYSMLRKISKVKIESSIKTDSIKSNATNETDLEFDLSSTDGPEEESTTHVITPAIIATTANAVRSTSRPNCTPNVPIRNVRAAIAKEHELVSRSSSMHGQTSISFLNTPELSNNRRTIRLSVSVGAFASIIHNDTDENFEEKYRNGGTNQDDTCNNENNSGKSNKSTATFQTHVYNESRDFTHEPSPLMTRNENSNDKWQTILSQTSNQQIKQEKFKKPTKKWSSFQGRFGNDMGKASSTKPHFRRAPLKTTKSCDLPSVVGTLDRESTEQPVSGNFRKLVQRNIQVNRKKKLFQSETLKVVQQLRKLRQELKATFLLTVVMATFLCLWTPFVIVDIMYYVGTFGPCTRQSHMMLLKYFKILHCMNSVVNPIYYILLNSKLKKMLRMSITSFRKKVCACAERKNRIHPI